MLAIFRRAARKMRLFNFAGRGHWYDGHGRGEASTWSAAHRFEVEHELLGSEDAKAIAEVVARR